MSSIDAYAAARLTAYRQADLHDQAELRRIATDRAPATGRRRLTALFPRFAGARTLRAA